MAEGAVQRFACTQCGKCCNRAPEVELSEAAVLADDFVFRLLFRLYRTPRSPAGYTDGSSERFYQEKRLLKAFAARQSPLKAGGVEYTQSLAISALALDRGSGACSALADNRCAIYERRPLSCRTVPFHYSRAEASLPAYLREFVASPDYACDTGPDAPVVLEGARLVEGEAITVREAALVVAAREQAWKAAIVRRLKDPPAGLPSLRAIEANAAAGALTTSMRQAWQIAVEAGLMGQDECRQLVARQRAVIERELAATCSADARETLLQMRAEYQART